MSAPTLPDYTLIRSRRKTLGLQVDQQGNIIVRAPMTTPQWRIRAFVAEQLSWIDRARQRQQKRLKNLPHIQEEDRERYAALAKQILPGKVAHYAAIMGVTPTGITVTGAKTRFGSCSCQNRLCFSWRLMAYPDEAIDYVVVHELAHIRHKNHSPAFYSFIEHYIHHVVRGRGTNVPTCGQSTTSGAWDSMRSHLFVSDICRFFIFFKDFGKRHADCRQMAALYARYRHVYLRVLAVKGCPWDDIKRFRNVLSPMRNPTNLLDALLFLPFINRLVAFLFRISRRKT